MNTVTVLGGSSNIIQSSNVAMDPEKKIKYEHKLFFSQVLRSISSYLKSACINTPVLVLLLSKQFKHMHEQLHLQRGPYLPYTIYKGPFASLVLKKNPISRPGGSVGNLETF